MNPSGRKTGEAITAGIILGCVLTWASTSFGLTWDETIYFQFSETIRDWFLHHRSFDPASLATYWGYSNYHNPHPPFMKIINAVGISVFSGTIPFPASYRLAHIIYISGCFALAWRLLRASFSGPMTAAAIGLVCLQPRVFGHLLIAATDSPVAMSWLVLTLIAWRLDQTPVTTHRPLLRGLLFLFLGIASATKITGFMVIFPLAAYFLVQKNFRECWWLVRAALFALLFVLLVSPSQWAHPLSAVGNYLTAPLLRSQQAISSFYLGRLYTFYLPWHYFPVMTAVTCPLAILLLFSGFLYFRKIPRHGLFRAIFFPLCFWLIIGHLPATPKHDGIRQLLSFYPFLGLLSWFGLRGWQWRLQQASSFPGQRLLQISLAPVILLLLVAGILRCHPFELSYYNSLIGGIRGAEKKGFEMSYYLEAIHPQFIGRLGPFLNNGKTISMLPPWPPLLEQYARHGLLTGEYTVSDDTGVRPDYLLILRRRGYVDDTLYTKVIPRLEVTYNGVSLAKFCAAAQSPTNTREDSGLP